MAEGARGAAGSGGAGRLRSAASRTPPPRRGPAGAAGPRSAPPCGGVWAAGSSPAAALSRRPRAERSGAERRRWGCRRALLRGARGRREGGEEEGAGARVPAGAERLP